MRMHCSTLLRLQTVGSKNSKIAFIFGKLNSSSTTTIPISHSAHPPMQLLAKDSKTFSISLAHLVNP